MTNLSTLPADIHRLLEGADLSASIGTFKDDIGKMMIRRFSETERKPSLSMSSIGRPVCQLWFEMNGHKGKILSGKTRFKFMYGDMIECLVLYLAEEAGHKVEFIQKEIELDGIPGHIDCVIDGVLVDVKSCSTYSYEKFKTGKVFTQDPFGYVGQLSGYAKALGLPAAWIPIDKVNGNICVTELPQHVIDDYDVHARIKYVKQVTSSKVKPERCFSDEPYQKSGNRKLGVTCGYCSHRSECWKDSNGGKGLREFFYSTGPLYLTHVEKEPRVQEQNFTTEELNFN